MIRLLAEIALIAVAAVLAARGLSEPWRGRALNTLKAWVTVRVFWLLAMHPVTLEDGSQVVAWRLILDTLRNLDPRTFWLCVAAAAGIKFVGILASMQRWRLLLAGQKIELPFRHIFGSFLIGRFIGTFLPSTAGLDGYTLYDAARFSGRTVEATTAKALEKVLGISGIFLSFLVALPAGVGMFHAIFGQERGDSIALVSTAICAAVVGMLLLLLWFPGAVQWVILRLPLPGKARIESVVLRVSASMSAYRDKKLLVVTALALSFVVHFTTAAMYYFTALAISATGAHFWPIVLASSIQILATVLSPFTIAGEGIRELAQLVLLQNMIGPAAAIVSAALGFWAAEALTLVGGVVWWWRPASYHPGYCRVNGRQVDYAEAARAARILGDPLAPSGRAPAAAPLPGAARLRAGLAHGFGAGVLGGLLVGGVETLVIAAAGFATEAQVLWYGPLAYALCFGGLGALVGAALALLPLDREELRGWTPALVWLASVVPFGLAITVFRLRRDVYLEQMPPLPVLAGVLAGFGALALALLFGAPRWLRGRAGSATRPRVAIAALVACVAAGFVAERALPLASPHPPAPAAVPAALADRPNLILVMVDTLRADHLSCYGGTAVATPNLCRVAEDGGTLYRGYSHASWTKPATATLLTSLVPSSHQTMSKSAALPEGVVTVAEALRDRGYATGGIVSNTNLSEAFGFSQGFDEYQYLGPDYLAGATESSSKLILYQIGRRVYFKLVPALRFYDFYQDSQVVNEHAVDWLERHRDSRFFLFLHYMDVHDPYFPHPYDGTGIARAASQDPPASQAAEMQRLYNGEIAYLDGNFGHLLDRLHELGLYDDTVIVLVADHGEEFQEHGGFWHGLTLYEEMLHVPLMVKWRRGEPLAPAVETDRASGLIDVAPTLLARAGAAVPPEMQGRDLARAADAAAERMLLAEEDHEGNVLRSVRSQQWKWIEANPDNPRGLPERELFDLAGDPGEHSNLADVDKARADELARHAAAQALAASQHRVGESRAAALSDAERQALIALGYLQDDKKPEPPKE